MSAFLGPIHHWLYNKITLQNQLVEDFLAYSKQALSLDLEDELETKFGTLSKEPLETIIEEDNIHGWLQGKIIVVEERLAYTVQAILKEEKERIEELKKIAFSFGTQVSTLTKDATPEQAYKMLNDTLLDGMPCDHVNQTISTEANKVQWKRSHCIHETYWTQYGMSTEVYYEIRSAWIKGLLSNTNITFTQVGENVFQLEKVVA